MLTRSRRKAREAALRALYEIEVGKISANDSIEATVRESHISHDLADYMETLVRGVLNQRRVIDQLIAAHLKGYELDRLVTVDRAVLRIATYELLYVPEMPPAVTINEAIEIVKRYSTAESGKFVNGVLGQLVLDTPKADWDPATAPPEFSEEPEEEEEATEIEEIEVAPDDPNFKAAKRVGGWKLRSDPS